MFLNLANSNSLALKAEKHKVKRSNAKQSKATQINAKHSTAKQSWLSLA